MVSRVLGLCRDIAVTALIPGASRDAFIVAFRFPNMLRDLVGEGASNAAFVPVLSETIENESEDAFRELTSALMSALIVILGVITVLGFVFVPHLFGLFGLLGRVTGETAVTPEDVALMRSLARWTFPYIFFIGMAVFAMGPLFIKKHYATPSWSPALLNLSLIAACFALRDRFADPAWALVVGVWIGGAAQLLVQYMALARHAGAWRPNFHLRHPGIRKALWLLAPVLIGQAAGEVNKLVDTMFAARLGGGSVTALFYANRLVQLPLSVFGIAIAAAILPTISRAAARGGLGEIRAHLMQGLRQSIFLIAPALAVLFALRIPIVALLFQRGAFDAADTERTAAALLFYAGGLICFAWVKVAVAGFYAVQDTRTPVIVASLSMCLNIALNFALVGSLRFRGLALATTISYSVNFLLLYALLSRRFGALWDAAFVSSILRTILAAGGTAVVLVLTSSYTSGLMPAGGLLARLVNVLIPLATAGLSYLMFCAVLRVPELGDFLSLVRSRKR